MTNVVRYDEGSWLPDGSVLFGEGGFGVYAEDIASGGYCENDLSLPVDNGKEICGRITVWPSAGTLFAYEDTSFTFSGAPDGTYTFKYQLYVDGVLTGSEATVTLNVGVTNVTISCSLGTADAYGFQATITVSGNKLKYWDGSSWISKGIPYYDGVNWIFGTLKRWDGSIWL